MDRKDTAKTQACPPFTGKQGTDFLAGIVLALLGDVGGTGVPAVFINRHGSARGQASHPHDLKEAGRN